MFGYNVENQYHFNQYFISLTSLNSKLKPISNHSPVALIFLHCSVIMRGCVLYRHFGSLNLAIRYFWEKLTQGRGWWPLRVLCLGWCNDAGLLSTWDCCLWGSAVGLQTSRWFTDIRPSKGFTAMDAMCVFIGWTYICFTTGSSAEGWENRSEIILLCDPRSSRNIRLCEYQSVPASPADSSADLCGTLKPCTSESLLLPPLVSLSGEVMRGTSLHEVVISSCSSPGYSAAKKIRRTDSPGWGSATKRGGSSLGHWGLGK